MKKTIAFALTLLAACTCAQAHPHAYVAQPVYPVYAAPAPAYYPPCVYRGSYAPSYGYGGGYGGGYAAPVYGAYAAPSISFGVGGGSSRVYFNIPLR